MDAPFSIKLTSSAVIVQMVEPGHYRNEEEWLSVEQIGDPTFPLQNIESRHVKTVAASMRMHALDYGNEMTTVTSSAECSPEDSRIRIKKKGR